MAGKSADDDIDLKKKTNFNKKPARKTAAKKASPPKPRSKPARKAAPPKPRAKPARAKDSAKTEGQSRKTPKSGATYGTSGKVSAKSGASRSTAGKKVSLPRAGMKSKGPAPKSNKSRKGNRIDRVR